MSDTKPNRPFGRIELEPSLAQLNKEVAEEFCINECSVREGLRPTGLVCSFMVREALKPYSQLTLPNLALWDVAQNTWLHCVSDVRRGDEPVILLTKEAEQTFYGIEEFLD